MANQENSKPQSNLDAADIASARLSQGLAILGLLEQQALDAVEDKCGFASNMKSVAESIWAARTLFEQAKEAMAAA